MAKLIRIDESMFEGAVSCEFGDDWIRPWRLPFEQLALFPPEDGIQARAIMAAGVRLRFSTDSSAIGMTLLPQEGVRRFDLTVDGELLQTATAAAGETGIEFTETQTGEHVYELWFPTNGTVEVSDLLLDDQASFRVPTDPRLKWVTYGSSITHCGGATSPSRSWPATAARARNLNLTCLGYGGQCHIDPMVARMIRDLPADLISLKLGINVQGGSTLNARTFKPAIIGMVQIIREKHPQTPIILVSPIISPPRESTPNQVGLSLEAMRNEVEDAWKRLVSAGDSNLYYVHGHKLFGEDLVGDYLPDLLHPNGDGYEIMGQNAAEQVLDLVLAQ
jgi:lysophospholipase L1-like esterase